MTDERKIVSDQDRPWLGGNIKGGDPDTYCPVVWAYLTKRFSPESICDVGCGEGYLLEYFKNKGIRTTGIEGLQENIDNAPELIRRDIVCHDFSEGSCDLGYFDMVLSCEFVEHVEEKYVPNFLDQFLKCSVLVFTYAGPNQPGHHHVNCRDSPYWVEMLESREFSLCPTSTQEVRELSGTTHWRTTLVFIKQRTR